MQNPITFLPTAPSASASNQTNISANANQSAPNSFNQILSKEISAKQNNIKEKPITKIENKAVEINKKSDTSDESATIQTKPEEESKTDIIPLENALPNSLQLIALVESLAQFSTKKLEDTIDTPTIDVPSIESDKPTIAVNSIANASTLTSVQISQPPGSATVTPVQFELATPPLNSNILSTTASNVSDDLSLASLASPSPASQAGMSQESLQNLISDKLIPPGVITSDLNSDQKTDLKINLEPDLKTVSNPTIKTDSKLDLKDNFKMDLAAVAKPHLESDPKKEVTTVLKPDQKFEVKTDIKIDPKTDLKIQDTLNSKEQNIKAAETLPSAQNFSQQIAVSSSQIVAASEVKYLAPRVGTPEWNQSVGQKIVWMVAGGQQTAELTLNPPDLGPMQVVLSVNNDQANATFISAHPDVRDALESAMPKLRQMMNDAGVQLTGFSVKSESSNAGTQFTGGQPSSRSKNNGTQSVASSASISATGSITKNSTGNGIVDTFA